MTNTPDFLNTFSFDHSAGWRQLDADPLVEFADGNDFEKSMKGGRIHFRRRTG